MSARVGAPSPGPAVAVAELTPTELHVAGQTFAIDAIADGRIQWGEVLYLRAHAAASYRSLLDTLEAAARGGVREIRMAVRAPGEATESWMAIEGVQVVDAEEQVSFPPRVAVSWDQFAQMADAAYRRDCAGQEGVRCELPRVWARGGEVEVRLFVRGDGARIDLVRVADETAPAVPLYDSTRIDEHIVLFDRPRTHMSVHFRVSLGVQRLAVLEALCGMRRCGVVVGADEATPLAKVVSALGAAYPYDVPLHVAFHAGERNIGLSEERPDDAPVLPEPAGDAQPTATDIRHAG